MAGSILFFVDTTVLIAHIRVSKTPSPFDLALTAFGEPVVSEIAVFELEVGARRAGRKDDFKNYFGSVRTYPLTLEVLMQAADIHAALLQRNQAIGAIDTFIAATAMYHRLPLFTLNTGHFQRVPGLTLLRLP